MDWIQEELSIYSLNIGLLSFFGCCLVGFVVVVVVFSQPIIYKFYNLSSDFSSELFSHF